MDSSDGPLESAMIRCPSGHIFNAPIEFLSFNEHATMAPENDKASHKSCKNDRREGDGGLDATRVLPMFGNA